MLHPAKESDIRLKIKYAVEIPHIQYKKKQESLQAKPNKNSKKHKVSKVQKIMQYILKTAYPSSKHKRHKESSMLNELDINIEQPYQPVMRNLLS